MVEEFKSSFLVAFITNNGCSISCNKLEYKLKSHVNTMVHEVNQRILNEIIDYIVDNISLYSIKKKERKDKNE